MNAEDLLMAFTDLDDEVILDAKEIPQSRMLNHRTLITVLIAAMLTLALVGCTYTVLTEADWFKNFFTEKSEQSLSEKQEAYIDEHTQEIAQSATIDGYTVTVESAIADQNNAYIKFRLQGPPGTVLDAAGGYLPGYKLLEDGNIERNLTRENDDRLFAYGASTRSLDDENPKDNSVYLLYHATLFSNTEITFEETDGWKFRIHDMNAYSEDGRDSETVFEGDMVFDINFTSISNEEISLLTEPLPYSFVTYRDHDAYLNSEPTYTEGYITSVVLRTMSAEITIEGIDDAVGFVQLPIVMKDGSSIKIGANSFGNGHYCYSAQAPIILDEVDHILLPDGTQLPAQQ